MSFLCLNITYHAIIGGKMNITASIKKFLENSNRIMNISYKPSADQFRKSARIILLGILLMGVVGFLIGAVLYFIITGTMI